VNVDHGDIMESVARRHAEAVVQAAVERADAEATVTRRLAGAATP
jgi:hypothetical protein